MQSAVCDSNQLFIVIIWEASLGRMLGIWKRAAKNSPENVLRVHYAGEDGIDSGAMAREFLTSAISAIE